MVTGERLEKKEVVVFSIASINPGTEQARARIPLQPGTGVREITNRNSISRTARRRLVILAAAALVTLSIPSAASAHNRGLVWLPTGECVQVGSLKSVLPGPDKSSELDLDPTAEGDNIGTSYAASEGNSAVEKGACP